MDAKNNIGLGNSGDGNSGDRNSGDGNSGHRNSGYGNSGDGNSGDGNSGHRNSGHRNSGYGNSGDGNSGYGNLTNRSSGIFCSVEPAVLIFNKPTDKQWEEIDHPHFFGFELNEWIAESQMTDQEKVENPKFHVAQGFLRTISWHDAWTKFWRETDDKNREKFLALPNFDATIFKEITGIDVAARVKAPTCDGKIVEIDGIEYELKAVNR